jgi:hypothetical protein
MNVEQTVTITLTGREAREYCKEVESIERALPAAGFREPVQVNCIKDALRDCGLGVRGSYDARPTDGGEAP